MTITRMAINGHDHKPDDELAILSWLRLYHFIFPMNNNNNNDSLKCLSLIAPTPYSILILPSNFHPFVESSVCSAMATTVSNVI